jgi:hypothetical protein
MTCIYSRYNFKSLGIGYPRKAVFNLDDELVLLTGLNKFGSREDP